MDRESKASGGARTDSQDADAAGRADEPCAGSTAGHLDSGPASGTRPGSAIVPRGRGRPKASTEPERLRDDVPDSAVAAVVEALAGRVDTDSARRALKRLGGGGEVGTLLERLARRLLLAVREPEEDQLHGWVGERAKDGSGELVVTEGVVVSELFHLAGRTYKEGAVALHPADVPGSADARIRKQRQRAAEAAFARGLRSVAKVLAPVPIIAGVTGREGSASGEPSAQRSATTQDANLLRPTWHRWALVTLIAIPLLGGLTCVAVTALEARHGLPRGDRTGGGPRLVQRTDDRQDPEPVPRTPTPTAVPSHVAPQQADTRTWDELTAGGNARSATFHGVNLDSRIGLAGLELEKDAPGAVKVKVTRGAATCETVTNKGVLAAWCHAKDPDVGTVLLGWLVREEGVPRVRGALWPVQAEHTTTSNTPFLFYSEALERPSSLPQAPTCFDADAPSGDDEFAQLCAIHPDFRPCSWPATWQVPAPAQADRGRCMRSSQLERIRAE